MCEEMGLFLTPRSDVCVSWPRVGRVCGWKSAAGKEGEKSAWFKVEP